MNNTEYYKSLISDEEVIKALIKESKAREGELFREKTRLKPNLNFFRRTVTNLVTSNKRVNTSKKLIYKETRKSHYKIRGKIKSARTLIKEIVTSNKINFEKAAGSNTTSVEDNLNEESDDSIEIIECDESPQISKSTDITRPIEKPYKDLDKYLVHVSEEKIKSKQLIQRQKPPLNTAKSKNIVFNLNINKNSATNSKNAPGERLKREKQ